MEWAKLSKYQQEVKLRQFLNGDLPELIQLSVSSASGPTEQLSSKFPNIGMFALVL